MYRNLVEATSDSIYLIDRQCRYLYVNPHHCARLGAPLQDLIGKNYQEFHCTPETNIFFQQITEVFQQGVSFQREHYSERDDCEFLRTFSPVRNTAGKITAVSVISKNITAWKIAERFYTTLAERSPIGLFIIQGDIFHWVNKRFQDNTGYAAEETIGKSSLSIVHPEDREYVRTNALAMLSDDSILPYEYRIVTKKGDILWYMGTVTSIEYKGKRAILGSQMDISRQKQAEDAQRQSEERSRNIIDTIADAYYEVDLAGNLLIFNEPFLNLFGRRENEMKGINYKSHVNKKQAEIAFRAYHQVFKTGKPLNKMEWEIINKSGEVRQVELSVSLVRNGQGKAIGFRGIMSDITARQKAAEAVRRQAFHDSLTNLANRILFNDRLLMAIKRAKRSQKMVAVMVLDLDNFKDVNDRWGHAAGDMLLKEVADRLADHVRDTDTVARQGGDEFSVALSSLTTPEDARRVAKKIMASFHQPFHLDSVNIQVTTSMGIAMFPDQGDDFDTLIKKADKAMYRAKTLGRNHYCFYDEPSTEKSVQCNLFMEHSKKVE
jgi:diguanylate cyclase (GGDEF)-like protein/PAS domain S-box-containing protein